MQETKPNKTKILEKIASIKQQNSMKKKNFEDKKELIAKIKI